MLHLLVVYPRLAVQEEIVNLDDVGVPVDANRFQLRDTVVPLEILQKYLPQDKGSKGGIAQSALITRMGSSLVGFRVEKITGPQQIVVRKLAPGMAGVFGISGGTILGSGQPGLIVDLPMISRHFLKAIQGQEKAA
jgi:two-component system chemotaxis sensor kinase CheA